MKDKKILVLMLVLSLFISACSHSSLNSPEQHDTVEEENVGPPQSGGTVNLGTTSILNMNPLLAKDDETKAFLSLIFEGLVKIDNQGIVQPALAETWQISDDGKTYTINLRPDVKWHNGEVFSSADVKATFDKIMELKKQKSNKDLPKYAEFDNIQSYEAPDDNTFIVSLYKPDADFLYELNLGILSASFFETSEIQGKGNEQHTENLEYIGTGPFEIFDKTSYSVTLKRNDNYFGNTPYLEEINIKTYADTTSLKEAFIKGEIDMITIEPIDWNIFQEMENVYLLQYPSRYFEFVAVNLSNPVLSDVNVRKAILLGIDRNRILQDTTLGRGIVIEGPILPYSWAFNSQIQHITYSKKMAEQQLEEAGWRDEDGDGILEKTIGNKKYKLEFELLVNTDNGARYQTASHIEKNLKDLGISVKLVNAPWNELTEKVMSKKYDTAIMGWKLAPNPDLRFMFASSEIRNGYNFVSYANPELDDVLDKAKTANEGRKELLYKAQEIINKDLPYLFLYSPDKVLALNKRLKGIKADPINLFNSVDEWWVDE
ncbi:MAG: hypothetical protein GX892_15335 [Thermoanaerobacteraceae bacterium]|nr:hypothetical protein [Thermoanaerobacteraceae bacterium]